MLQFSRHPFGHASEIQPQAERPDSDPSKACILIDELTRAVRLTRYDAHKDDAGLAEGPRDRCIAVWVLSRLRTTLLRSPRVRLKPSRRRLLTFWTQTQIYQSMNVYRIKMADVFAFSTSTILLRTRIVPRWLAVLGYGSSDVLLPSIEFIRWVPLVFPIWVFLVRAAIRLENPSGLRERNGELEVAKQVTSIRTVRTAEQGRASSKAPLPIARTKCL